MSTKTKKEFLRGKTKVLTRRNKQYYPLQRATPEEKREVHSHGTPLTLSPMLKLRFPKVPVAPFLI